MSGQRSHFRDVLIWDLNDNEDRIPLGGLTLTAGVTNTDFRQMLDILLIISGDYVVQNERGNEILRDTHPLLPGNYTVIADTIEVSLLLNIYRVFSFLIILSRLTMRSHIREYTLSLPVPEYNHSKNKSKLATVVALFQKSKIIELHRTGGDLKLHTSSH